MIDSHSLRHPTTTVVMKSLLWLWLLLPILLTIFIFSPAFLKFLLVAAPAAGRADPVQPARHADGLLRRRGGCDR